VRRHALDLAVLFTAATLTALIVALSQPSLRSITIRSYVFAVGALLMLALVAAASDALPRRRGSELERALESRGRERQPVRELARLEREVTLAIAAAHDLHTRLLPQLREIARCRLEREGRVPCEETLGRWWELLRPDCPEPEDRFAPGIPERELRALVADLERL
jgi:hypothetical protein